ncbi:rcc01693 family protein [Yoonia sediminilitoris]|uniref:Putative phage protein (TIGR02216 family) n=1 Tax=Yoonia sediminilitoris TaxID=1286148 RepID=A0A2T6KDL2_9RHOB|nr:rcc01693 family protein [Yoonia sediminilitoris]PUB13126.1 putative phage protein (TIGR02216 family) [Yoonia sediminilitoris]RCW94461.1 putative phage protein (TIGR02216 family) [Yoonia sediminilitoris]
MNGLDWPRLMLAGMHGLRLKPADFWALTPAELQLMLGQTEARSPMGRKRLGELEQAYPDRQEDVKNG